MKKTRKEVLIEIRSTDKQQVLEMMKNALANEWTRRIPGLGMSETEIPSYIVQETNLQTNLVINREMFYVILTKETIIEDDPAQSLCELGSD